MADLQESGNKKLIYKPTENPISEQVFIILSVSNIL